MMRWLRGFFSGSGDPIVRVIGGVTRQQAEMWGELLENGGVRALVKSMGVPISYIAGHGEFFEQDWDIFVNRSDLERAREILAPIRSEAKDSDRRKHRGR